MTEEKIIDECFNCKKKKDIGDNWRTCKLKCSYKYKRKENDYITRLEQENKELGRKAFLAEQNVRTTAATFCDKDKKIIELEQENKELKKQIESQKGLITVGGEQQYEMTMAYDKCKTALEEINLILDELKQQYDYMTDYSEIKEIQDKINEVLK